MLNSNFLFSPRFSEIGDLAGQLAIMSTPGAIKSGYNIKQKNVIKCRCNDKYVFNLLFITKEP